MAIYKPMTPRRTLGGAPVKPMLGQPIAPGRPVMPVSKPVTKFTPPVMPGNPVGGFAPANPGFTPPGNPVGGFAPGAPVLQRPVVKRPMTMPGQPMPRPVMPRVPGQPMSLDGERYSNRPGLTPFGRGGQKY